MSLRAATPVVACLAGLACASSWDIDQAMRHLEAGRPDRALHHSERAIAAMGADAARLALHGAVLRQLGREVEALAFEEFSRRHAAGQDTEPAETHPSRRECSAAQPGAELLRAWGERLAPRRRAGGSVAARFEIDADGAIAAIRVLSARDPASAWYIIDSIAAARVSPSRLEWRRKHAPDSFPVPLCVWWQLERPGSLEVEIPDGGCIRGFCTHTPGSAPHM